MTIAYWCVLVMIIFPYFFTYLAKSSRKYDNHEPRKYLANVTGWRKRADYVQINSFEMTPAFAVAVIIAHLAHANQSTLNQLAIAFVISRVIYAICYLTDQASLRSLFWGVGMVCILALFYIAA